VIAFILLQSFINEPYRFNERHVHIRSTVQNQQRASQSVNMRDGRCVRVDFWISLWRADSAVRPITVIGIVVVHVVIYDAGDVNQPSELRVIHNLGRSVPCVAKEVWAIVASQRI
jgi:hypothetical protein